MSDAEDQPRPGPERDDVEEVPAEDIQVETVEEHGWIEHDESGGRADKDAGRSDEDGARADEGDRA